MDGGFLLGVFVLAIGLFVGYVMGRMKGHDLNEQWRETAQLWETAAESWRLQALAESRRQRWIENMRQAGHAETDHHKRTP